MNRSLLEHHFDPTHMSSGEARGWCRVDPGEEWPPRQSNVLPIASPLLPETCGRGDVAEELRPPLLRRLRCQRLLDYGPLA
jgi:hypothetical protein